MSPLSDGVMEVEHIQIHRIKHCSHLGYLTAQILLTVENLQINLQVERILITGV